MWGHYWWDNENYPQCDGALSYAALTEEPDSVETEAPEASPSPEVSPSQEPETENSQSP